MTTTPASLATRAKASVVGPGTGSASANAAWSSLCGKYCDRNSSGRQTTCAPSRAARRTCAAAVSTFAAGSGVHRIWTRPMRNRAAGGIRESVPVGWRAVNGAPRRSALRGPPPRHHVEAPRVPRVEILEPGVAELRELDQVAVGVEDRRRAEEAGVAGTVQQRHAALLQTPRERVDVEDGERELHGADSTPSVGERRDGMD